MSGWITGIKRMEIHDGDGIRTTVFFKGCSLKCIWCHNPEGISAKPVIAFYPDKCIGCRKCRSVCPTGTADAGNGSCIGCGKCAEECLHNARILYGEKREAAELAEKLAADKAFFDASGGGVTFSGGECLMQLEFAVALASELKQRGISVDIDTCGYVPRSAIMAIQPYTDTFLYDIKALDGELHRRLTGRDNSLILDNLAYLSSVGAKIEVRIPLVMGYNDGEIPAIAEFLSGLSGIRKVKVLRYHDMARSKYRAVRMEDTMPHTATTARDVEQAVEILKSKGLNAAES